MKDKNMTIISYKNPRCGTSAKGSLAQRTFAPRFKKPVSKPVVLKPLAAEKRLHGTLTMFDPTSVK